MAIEELRVTLQHTRINDAEVYLSVKVVPGASRDQVAGLYGDGIKVQVSAPPENGRANEGVVAILAKFLGVSSRQIDLVAGTSMARKRFRIRGVAQHQLDLKLRDLKGA